MKQRLESAVSMPISSKINESYMESIISEWSITSEKSSKQKWSKYEKPKPVMQKKI